MKVHTINRVLRPFGLVLTVTADSLALTVTTDKLTIEPAPKPDPEAKARAERERLEMWLDPRLTCAYCPGKTIRNAKGECGVCGGTAMEVR